MLTLLTGGARSGKSTIAVNAAAARDEPVTVIATATAGDDEMAERIARHQADRPQHWSVIEEPVDLLEAVASVAADYTIIVDCLALWLNNRMGEEPEQILKETVWLADLLAERIAGHRSAEPGNLRMLEYLNLEPLLDLDSANWQC